MTFYPCKSDASRRPNPNYVPPASVKHQYTPPPIPPIKQAKQNKDKTMNFSEFLKANNLPEIDEQVIDPEDGMVYTVDMYMFSDDDEVAIMHADGEDYEISFDKLRTYRKMSDTEIYSDLIMEQQEQM